MKPYQPRRGTRLHDIDQLPAKTYVQEQTVKQSHFAKLLDGAPIAMTQVIVEARAMLETKVAANATVVRSIHAVPSQHFWGAKNALIY